MNPFLHSGSSGNHLILKRCHKICDIFWTDMQYCTFIYTLPNEYFSVESTSVMELVKWEDVAGRYCTTETSCNSWRKHICKMMKFLIDNTLVWFGGIVVLVRVSGFQ